MNMILRSRLLNGAAAALGSGIMAGLLAIVAPAAHGQIFVGVYNNSTLREYAYDGTYTQFAAYPDVNSPYGIAFDGAGALYTSALILGSQGKINKFAPDGTATQFAITPLGPRDMDFGPDGKLYVAIQDGTIWRYGTDGSGTLFASGLANPTSLAFDSAGDLFVTCYGSKSIAKITSAGAVSTFVSTGSSTPYYAAFDSSDRLYVSFGAENIIRRYTTDGTATTFATTFLNGPSQLAFDPSGNLWVSNYGNGALVYFTPDGTGTQFTIVMANSSGGLAFAPVPEPATFAALAGLAALLVAQWRRRARAA